MKTSRCLTMCRASRGSNSSLQRNIVTGGTGGFLALGPSGPAGSMAVGGLSADAYGATVGGIGGY
jgi:hypothetical protein